MRVLCLSAPLPGHLDWGGYLATATTLAERGHTLLWASGNAVAAQVMRAGLPFHELGKTGWRWPPPSPLQPAPDADAHTLQLLRQRRALDQWLDEGRVAHAVTELRRLLDSFQPDLLLSEMFVAAAGLVAEEAHVPLVVMGWPAPQPQSMVGSDVMVIEARQRLESLLARFALTGINWTSVGPPALASPLLHITYWSPSWFAGMAIGAQSVHVGGVQAPASTLHDEFLPPPNDALWETPWVLITLGTSFNVDPNFFIAAAHAADALGCIPLLALGEPLDAVWVKAMRPRLPARAFLRPHVDFDTVLPRVAAAIHHGGAGTTHALVLHAVPHIVVPHAADQTRQAQGVMRSGVGHYLPPKEVTVARLVDLLAELLPDRSPLRANAVALQAEFAALGGVPTAADLLEQAILD